MKDVTYNQYIQMLNGLCKGLGYAVNANRKQDRTPKEDLTGLFTPSRWLGRSFTWEKSPEGFEKWNDIFSVLIELEIGRGIGK